MEKGRRGALSREINEIYFFREERAAAVRLEEKYSHSAFVDLHCRPMNVSREFLCPKLIGKFHIVASLTCLAQAEREEKNRLAAPHRDAISISFKRIKPIYE
jgi:hypothetical protein